MTYPKKTSKYPHENFPWPERDEGMPLPQLPTLTDTGSEARIQIYRQRVARGEQLHHPDDTIKRTAEGFTRHGNRYKIE